MLKLLMKGAKYPLAASLLFLAVPIVSSRAMERGVSAAPSHFCYYYASYKESGGSVVCYGGPGTGCAVCAT
jgi:hypothetical protein